MSDTRIARVIEALGQVRERPGMYTDGASPDAMAAFLHGFATACVACGLPAPDRTLATVARGWPASAEVWSIGAMREHGLSDDAIADEMLAIDLAAWRVVGERLRQEQET